MSDSGSADGPSASPALATLGTAAALTRSSSASGTATITAAPAASHLNTGSSLNQIPGKATRRCTHPVRSPCKRHPPPAKRRQNPPLTTSRHQVTAAVHAGVTGGGRKPWSAARRSQQRRGRAIAMRVISSAQVAGSTHLAVACHAHWDRHQGFLPSLIEQNRALV